MLDRAGVTSTFVDGLRVTDAATMEVAEMVLSGAINKEIVNFINQAGAAADVRGVGLSGKDARLITVDKAQKIKRDPDTGLEEIIDLGFVGEPRHIDPQIINALINANEDYIPVVAPIGVSDEGETYNINADTVAGSLAGALSAKRMLLLTDVRGVLDRNGELIRSMTVIQAEEAIFTGVATGGMIPKLRTAIAAVNAGVEAVVILDGRQPHAMLAELFSESGSGTLIRA
jgi:acetylglutamate kinase